MRKPSTQRIAQAVVLLMRLALGATFLLSSLPKLRQPYDFLSNVYAYELLGPELGLVVAMVLPWLELCLAICLLGGILDGAALLASILLAGLFTAVQASALYRGLDISCGCFEAVEHGRVSYATLKRTSSFLLAASMAYPAWLYSSALKSARKI